MLTFEMLIVSTILLVFPVVISFLNLIKYRDNLFLQMILGYNVCYFLKSFYVLTNRMIHGYENYKLGLDMVALFGTILFLIVAEFCLYHNPEQWKCKDKNNNLVLKLFLLIGFIAMALEGVSKIWYNPNLFTVVYIISIICIYVISAKIMIGIRKAKRHEVK